MRVGVIQRIVSRLLWFAVAAMVPSLALSFSLGEPQRISLSWLVACVLAGVLATACARLAEARAAPRDSLQRREGFLAVTLGWLVLVLSVALAYFMSGEFPGFAGAFFESMSGFTTTGATVISDIEGLPRSILLMRSFSHWVGGMGIIVLSVAILPELAVGGMQLFSAESTGLGADKLAPRINATARRLWIFYLVITCLQTALLLPAMDGFDAVNHAMATIATGGFSTKNASIASFDSLYVEVVVICFMFVSGVGFTLQLRALRGAPGVLWSSPEVRLYCALTFGAIFLIASSLWLRGHYGLAESIRHSSFTTVSILTTTGFGTEDFNRWPDFCRILLVGLMLIGGCAGSTAGGSKVVRLYVVAKHAIGQLHRLIRPRLVNSLTVGDAEITRDTTEGILGYYLLFFASITILGLAMTALGEDLITGTTAAVSAMNSIGPGLAGVGATENFGSIHDAGLYLLSGGMLLGRLEIYPVLVLFSSHFWRRG